MLGVLKFLVLFFVFDKTNLELIGTRFHDTRRVSVETKEKVTLKILKI